MLPVCRCECGNLQYCWLWLASEKLGLMLLAQLTVLPVHRWPRMQQLCSLRCTAARSGAATPAAGGAGCSRAGAARRTGRLPLLRSVSLPLLLLLLLLLCCCCRCAVARLAPLFCLPCCAFASLLLPSLPLLPAAATTSRPAHTTAPRVALVSWASTTMYGHCVLAL